RSPRRSGASIAPGARIESPFRESCTPRNNSRSGPSSRDTPQGGQPPGRVPPTRSSRRLLREEDPDPHESWHAPQRFAENLQGSEELHPDISGGKPQATGDFSGGASVTEPLQENPTGRLRQPLQGAGYPGQIRFQVLLGIPRQAVLDRILQVGDQPESPLPRLERQPRR